MPELKSLPLFPDSYLGDTIGVLDESGHGIYLLLLMLSWMRPERGFPDDMEELARWFKSTCGMHGNRFNKLVPKVIHRYFKLDAERGVWTQKRLEKVRDSALKRQRNAVEMSEKRWHDSNKNNDLQNPRQSTQPNPTQPKESNTPHSPPEKSRVGSGFMDEGGKGFGGRSGISLKQATLDSAKRIMPRADVHSLEQQWKAMSHEMPENPDGAFIGWCKKFARNHPELTG